MPAASMTGNRALLFSFLALAGVLAVAEFSALDLAVQDRCYDFAQHRWRVDKDDPTAQFWFYRLPKRCGAALIVYFVAAAVWRDRLGLGRREAIYLLVCLLTVPVLVALMKRYSGVFCPWDLARYGGSKPYVRLFETLPPGIGRGSCFPAAHPSGGFALMAFCFVAGTRRKRWLGAAFGFVLGWTMGGYQMLKGAHYFSHVAVTMIFAWIFALTCARWFRIPATSRSPLPLPRREADSDCRCP